jgi:hypothetical protein
MIIRLSLCALLAVNTLTGTAAGQALPDPSAGYLVVLEPREWTGEGTRGIVRGRAVRVEGLAHHASGIRQVSINGAPAVLRRDRSGATRFSGRLTAAALEQDVEIVAYPVAGDPVARIQHPDGTFRTGSPAALMPPLPVLEQAEIGNPLRVSLQALPEASRQLVATSFANTSGIVVAVPGSRAHLSLAADGGGFVVLGSDGAVRHRVEAGSPDEGAAALQHVLAQELGALQLELLRQPREPFPLELAFASGAGRFRIGDGIEFRATSAREGYLTVVDLGTDGTVAVLFPTELDDPAVHARQPIALPSEVVRAQFAPYPPYQAGEPYGRGAVRAFVTPRPLALVSNADGTIPAEVLLRALRDATTDATGRELPWATVLLEYFITQ